MCNSKRKVTKGRELANVWHGNGNKNVRYLTRLTLISLCSSRMPANVLSMCIHFLPPDIFFMERYGQWKCLKGLRDVIHNGCCIDLRIPWVQEDCEIRGISNAFSPIKSTKRICNIGMEATTA